MFSWRRNDAEENLANGMVLLHEEEEEEPNGR